jgi:two-component system, chemotaxis family, chemotaxis protein CheY
MSKIKHVCIVDDDDLFQFVMRQHLERLEMVEHIHKFSDGEQALNYIKANIQDADSLPELILLDVNMPYMDGWQFMREFVKLTLPADKKIRIYILSSSTHESDLQKAKEFPVLAGYLVKPVNKQMIQQILQESLPAHT